MFEKLFLLVKNNAGTAVIDNPAIPVKYHEAVINEASSSIIEVLKGQVESGKIKDLIRFFKFEGIYNNILIKNVINRFAGKLNFYGLDQNASLLLASSLITPVMTELLMESKDEKNKDFGLSKLLLQLGGRNADMKMAAGQMLIA